MVEVNVELNRGSLEESLMLLKRYCKCRKKVVIPLGVLPTSLYWGFMSIFGVWDFTKTIIFGVCEEQL